jgi:membrane protein DedA with SNARE-associated domain
METVVLIDKIGQLYASWGYLLVFLGSLIETSPMGWAIPGGVILAVGGFFAYSGEVSLIGVIILGWLGQWTTFLLAYYFGGRSGDFLVKKLKQEKNAQRAKLLLEKHGGMILTTSMLANLTRFWVAYVAGAQKYKFIKFLFYSGAASLTWSSLMVIVGYLAGSEREKLESGLASLGIVAWGLVFLALAIIYLSIRKEFKQTIDI